MSPMQAKRISLDVAADLFLRASDLHAAGHLSRADYVLAREVFRAERAAVYGVSFVPTPDRKSAEIIPFPCTKKPRR